MITMHSFFDLHTHRSASEFHSYINDLSNHLIEKGLLLSHRFMKHQAHDGYNANEPASYYYHAMNFLDMDQAERCWSYIEEDAEPVKALHGKIKTSVLNTSFSLYREFND